MYTEQLTQALSPIDYILPSNAAAGTTNSSGIDLQKFRRAIFLIEVGAMAASSTLDAKLQSCVLANFASGVHSMTGGAITQIANTSNNVIVSIETTDEAAEKQNPGDRYIRLQCVVTTAAVNYSAIGLGGEAQHKPASNQTNTTTVPQQVVVT